MPYLGQLSLVSSAQIFKASMEAKLTGLATGNQWLNFLRCGREEIYRTCKCCGAVETFNYRCCLKWCPLCNYRIADDRQKIIRAWSLFIRQGKHVVVTVRNPAIFTRRTIRKFQKALVRLRRSKLFKKCRGGTCSIEITNEGRGWHIHAHMLIDMDWLDQKELAIKWAKLVGQDFAIVYVKDAREKDYARECAKYVVKGSDIASWPGDEMWQFLAAIKGCRFFFAFGSVLERKKDVLKILAAAKPGREPCDCGARDYIYENETSAVVNQIRRETRRR